MSNLLDSIKNEKRVTAKLSDYIKIKHGFAFKGEYFSNHPTKEVLVTPGNFAIGGGFKDEKYKYYAGSVPEDYILKPGDLVVTMTDLSVNADTLGYSAIIPRKDDIEFLHNQRIGLVQEIKKGIDMGFLHYVMRTREYHSYILGSASGSTVRHTSPDRITSYEYAFPSLPTQQKISEILNAYDKKIESNNAIIKNLEKTAQEIFDEWFIRFHFPGFESAKYIENEMGKIPEGWEVRSLDQIADFLNGIALQKFPAKANEDFLPVIKIREMNSGVDANTEKASKDIDKKYIIKDNDVLFSWSGSLEVMIWFGGDGALNQHIFKVTSSIFDQWFYYFWLKTHLRNFRAIASGKATTMGHIQKHHLSEALVLVPGVDLLKKGSVIFDPIFNKIFYIKNENQMLKQSRDQLLTTLI